MQSIENQTLRGNPYKLSKRKFIGGRNFKRAQSSLKTDVNQNTTVG